MTTGRLAAIAALLSILSFGIVSAGQAAPQVDVSRCLELSKTHPLDSKRIIGGLGLTPVQVRAVRARLSQYDNPSRYQGLDGLGLTSAQLAEIQRRVSVQVAEMNKYPVGWPCPAFSNPKRTLAWVRAKLVANGFRPAMRVARSLPRQIVIDGIQDGIEYDVVVVRSAPKQITIYLDGVNPAGSYLFDLPFVP